jgi:hypothetical protein
MLNKIKSLSKFNAIKFIEDEHLYLINNKKATGSITKVISDSKPKFDTDKWSNYKAKQRNISQQEILKEWETSSKFSTHLGTILHSYAENYWFNKIKKYDQEKVKSIFGVEEHKRMHDILASFIKSFHSLYNQLTHLTPIRAELVVGDIDHTNICGTIDLLAFNSELNGFEIYDYKTNKKFTRSSNYNERFTNPILSHLDVCDLNSYSLQQSLYKYIIEKHTDIKIVACNLIWFNRENLTCEKIPCVDMTEYCEPLLKDFYNTKNTLTTA